MAKLRSHSIQAILGESALWCERSQTFWMVDIRGPAVYKFVPATGDLKKFEMPDMTGMVALTEHDLLAGIGRTVRRMDPESGELGETIIEFDVGLDDNRINDSKIGPDLALWCGTMSKTEDGPFGALHHYSATGESKTLKDQITIPNALCFSTDGKTAYFADTAQGEILKTPVDANPSSFSHFAAADVAPGYPDGSCMDAEGFIWNARYAGSCVVRINPQGKADRIIKLPVSQPTCCALGGKDMKTLFITSANQNLDDKARLAEPLSGDLFMIDVDVPGLPEPRFAG